MINVLFISHDAHFSGGAQKSLFDLLRGLDRNRINSIVMAPEEGAITNAARSMGLFAYAQKMERWIGYDGETCAGSWAHLKKVFDALKARAAAVAAIIERHAVDLVYTNTVTCIEGAVAARLSRRAHLWHLRESIRGNSSLRSPVPAGVADLLIAALSDRIVLNSFFLRQCYPWLANRKKTTIVYNGIDTAQFRPDADARRELAESVGVKNGARVVACIGNIMPLKNQMSVVQAAALIKKESRRTVCFLLAGCSGQAQYYNDVLAEIARLGMREDIRMLGWRDDIDKILPAVDVAISASQQESFGRTVLEAMACGAPVVATRCGGPQEMVIDGATGYLVPLNSPAELAAAALRLVDDPELAQRFGKAGRRRVEREFSLRSYTERIQKIIEEVAGAPTL